jgi:very-short-patch-repair endonuclease
MSRKTPIAVVIGLAERSSGAFRGRTALEAGLSRKQLVTLQHHGAIERVLPDTYRLVAAARSHEQAVHAALLWAGPRAAADGRSAARVYGLEGAGAGVPEIVVPTGLRRGSAAVVVRHTDDRRALMIRRVRGIQVTGVEPTLVRLAHLLDGEAFEVACEDARRRRLTSVPALGAYLDRFGAHGRNGVSAMRELLRVLDPAHPANSTLEVKTRRLLLDHHITDFVREHPLGWNGRTYRYDFAFPRARTILETNGRRWHDDATDYEHDNEKWSVPGRYGYRLVLATWAKVTVTPEALIDELRTTMAARQSSSAL